MQAGRQFVRMKKGGRVVFFFVLAGWITFGNEKIKSTGWKNLRSGIQKKFILKILTPQKFDSYHHLILYEATFFYGKF